MFVLNFSGILTNKYNYVIIYIIFINFKLIFIIAQDVGDISSESEHITT